MYFFGLDHFLALGQARSGFRSIRVWAVYYYGSKATAMSTHCIGRIGLDHVFFSCGSGKVPMLRFTDEPDIEDACGGVYDATVDP
jgi:hypothetical protein